MHVICLQANGQFHVKYLQLASPRVVDLVAQLLWQFHQHKVQQILFGGSGDPKLAGIRGMLFEPHGHRQIPDGGTFHMRQLLKPVKRKAATAEAEAAESDSTALGIDRDLNDGPFDDLDGMSHHYSPDVEGAWDFALETTAPVPSLIKKSLALGGTLPDSDLVAFNRVSHVWDSATFDLKDAANIYMQPLSSNNAAYDAYYSNSGPVGRRLLLQYTVSTHHGIRAKAVIQFLKRLKDVDRSKVIFVFVVPPERYSAFSWQPWLGSDGKVGRPF